MSEKRIEKHGACRAAARAQGVDAGAFVERLTLAAVAEVEAKCGGRLPFTRHERAALARYQG